MKDDSGGEDIQSTLYVISISYLIRIPFILRSLKVVVDIQKDLNPE